MEKRNEVLIAGHGSSQDRVKNSTHPLRHHGDGLNCTLKGADVYMVTVGPEWVGLP